MAVTKVRPTKGEALVIQRRRDKIGQIEAARRRGVSVDRYREWEADVRTEEIEDPPRVGRLESHEICFLLRRRHGLKQWEVAAAVGVTRLWVLKMEEGVASDERLRQYWREKCGALF